MKKICKYPVIMNEHRRKFLRKLRRFHFIFASLMAISVFFPKRFLNYSFIIWFTTILINLYFSGDASHCCIQYFEWRSSNCENYAILHEVFNVFSIDKKHSKMITKIFYIIFTCIILIRIYIHGITF